MITLQGTLRRLQRVAAGLGPVNLWGFKFVPPSVDRRAALYLIKTGLMGVGDRKFFEQEIKPGMTVLDIGANQGVYTALFSRLVGPSGSVFSFEPDPALFGALEANCRRNALPNVHLFNVGLGAGPGRMTLYKSLVHQGDNRLSRPEGLAVREAIDVEIAAADDLLQGRTVDFVKVDVQGWEPFVFQGMKRLLSANPEIRLYFEFWPEGIRMAGLEESSLFSLLPKERFQIFCFGPGGWQTVGAMNDLAPLVKKGGYINLFASRNPPSSQQSAIP